MIEYRVGHEPAFWEPDPSVSAHRFALGRASRASAVADCDRKFLVPRSTHLTWENAE